MEITTKEFGVFKAVESNEAALFFMNVVYVAHVTGGRFEFSETEVTYFLRSSGGGKVAKNNSEKRVTILTAIRVYYSYLR